jgi:hypothetical protein
MLDPLLVGPVLLVLLLPGAETRLLCNVTNVTDTSVYSLFQVVPIFSLSQHFITFFTIFENCFRKPWMPSNGLVGFKYSTASVPSL